MLKHTIGFILLTLTTLAKNSFASIGEVTLHKGIAVVDRQDGDKGIEVQKDLDIFSYDTVKTGNGKVGIQFIDQTRVDVTEHSTFSVFIGFQCMGFNRHGNLLRQSNLGG